ncbi:putative mitochondrial protein cyt-4 [Diaporthe ampelina]|uniref:Putative mitochondrial protein cyt-4 n=1 Tax=Diaporthe ampelina TaxID=1214573 RepID=A0A0G2HPH0_9PEZI|nr:putative mitochondrial protein cyt-4 [Diaporthe ampelina]
MAILAICLGNLHGVYHFYTITGKWHPTPKTSSKFVVRNFVTEKLIQPVFDKLPKEALPWETLRTMRQLKLGPDRESGSVLLRAMLKFQQLAEAALQKHATRLENAHQILADGRDRYLTLEQITTCLIHREREDKDKQIPSHTLFAVHRTLMTNDVGFRLVGVLGPTRKTLYEVTPPEDVLVIQNMQTLVRLFTDIPGKVKTQLRALKSSVLSQSQIGRFILKARDVIDQSRRYRDWTPHGTISPAKKPRSPLRTEWTDIDLSILHFMHLWAGYDQFSLSSSFQSIGSTILRALGRYNDSEYLSTSTGWTFLQEVGYLSPWEIHSRYTQRVPGVSVSREKGFERMELGPDGVSAHLTPDRFAGKRKDWTGHRVFAIDSKDTVDVDDAVSIEKTDNPDEYWIHVHVADPASRIQPDSRLGMRAQLLPLNLYLSGHQSNIWGVGNEVQELFSLGPDKPCLTFSGRVNNNGELLEYTVKPGQLKDIIFITPEEVNKTAGFEDSRRPPAWATTKSFSVGQSPPKKPENRKMVSASELRQDEIESLEALHRLAMAIHDRRLAKGSVPVFPLRANAKASFDETSINEAPSGLMTCNGDPYITISWNDGSEAPLVTNTMVLAGEVAARWCVDRNIPIPFTKQSGAEKNKELLKAYTEKVYYPALLSGQRPSTEQSRQFHDLVGPDEVSTRPGPHFIMGLDVYAKVTSPLRRYSDLLAHWQIEHALLQEMETGKVESSKLPFGERKLDTEVLPWMLLRQRIIRRLGNVDGNITYMHQALFRAWKYPSEHDSRLPDTFRYTIGRTGGFVTGWLDWFGLDACMVSDGLARLGISLADLRRGDVLVVKLKDINVHTGEVYVEAVGRPSTQEHSEV